MNAEKPSPRQRPVAHPHKQVLTPASKYSPTQAGPKQVLWWACLGDLRISGLSGCAGADPRGRRISGQTMTLSGLLDIALTDPALRRALDEGETTFVGPPSMRPVLAGVLARTAIEGGAVLAITATGREAEDLTSALTSLLDPNAV